MTITHYEPWAGINNFHNEINRLFDHRATKASIKNSAASTTARNWTPAVDIKEEGQRFTIFIDIPGVENKDIDISMEKGVLSIKGERHSDSTQADQRYKRVERSHGTFYRSFSLPDAADANNITAKNSNGVLEITIPKQAQTQPRKITVED